MTTTQAVPALRYSLASHEELTSTTIELVSALRERVEDELDSRLYFAIREMEDAIERHQERNEGGGILPELTRLIQHQLVPCALQHANALLRASQLRESETTTQVEPALRVGRWHDGDGVIIPLTEIAAWGMRAWSCIFADEATLELDRLAQDEVRAVVGDRLAAALAT